MLFIPFIFLPLYSIKFHQWNFITSQCRLWQVPELAASGAHMHVFPSKRVKPCRFILVPRTAHFYLGNRTGPQSWYYTRKWYIGFGLVQLYNRRGRCHTRGFRLEKGLPRLKRGVSTKTLDWRKNIAISSPSPQTPHESVEVVPRSRIPSFLDFLTCTEHVVLRGVPRPQLS